MARLGSSFLVAAALLVSPLLVFLRFHGASLVSGHALALAGALLAAAAVAALAAEARGAASRAVVFGALAALFAEWQSQSALPVAAVAGAGLAGGAAAFALRRQWSAAGAVAAAFLAASALLPVGGGAPRVGAEGRGAEGARAGVERVRDAGAAHARDASLPPVLVLVLDEHAGVEAIPAAFDPGAHRARELRDAWLARGFRVFGRAYSRYFLSRDSFSAMFNDGDPTRVAGTQRRVFLGRNARFVELARRRYALRVIQTDYLDLCVEGRGFALESCRTFALESPAALDGASLLLAARARLLAGLFARLSSRLPAPETARVGALTGMDELDALEREVTRLEPGVALVAHVMLPHFPYAWNARCELVGDPARWEHGAASDGGFAHFSEASRARRYPPYLAQLACTQARVARVLDALDANPAARGAWVIALGDHGSRIASRRPSPREAEALTADDLRDAFATFFAVRKPGHPALYDRRLVPLDALVPAALAPGALPDDPSWASPPRVVLSDLEREVEIALPAFARPELAGDEDAGARAAAGSEGAGRGAVELSRATP